MFSQPAKKLLQVMMHYPIQQFGELNEKKNNNEGMQHFLLVDSLNLNGIFYPKTKFIMSGDKENQVNGNKIQLRFDAYYLRAKRNGQNNLVLSDKGDIFITDTLTGCTILAVQLENKVKVYHLNMVDEENGFIDQGKIDDLIEQLPAKEKNNILFKLTKNDYSYGDNPVSLIGIRHNSHWSFHYQIFTEKRNKGKSEVGFYYINTMDTTEKLECVNHCYKS